MQRGRRVATVRRRMPLLFFPVAELFRNFWGPGRWKRRRTRVILFGKTLALEAAAGRRRGMMEPRR